MLATFTEQAPEIVSEQGRCYLAVPWREAEKVHDYLGKQGCPSTLCLDPSAQQARLELGAGVDQNRVLEILKVPCANA